MAATNIDDEKRYLPVRIPIFKGLTGYRLFLMDKAKQSLLRPVQSLEQLRQFSIGQRIGWHDARSGNTTALR